MNFTRFLFWFSIFIPEILILIYYLALHSYSQGYDLGPSEVTRFPSEMDWMLNIVKLDNGDIVFN